MTLKISLNRRFLTLFYSFFLFQGLLCNQSVAADFEQGLLWQIKQGGVVQGYLFGSIHLDNPEVVTLPEVVENAFEQSPHFVMETILDSDAIMTIARRMALPQGQLLSSLLSEKSFQQLQQSLVERGHSRTDVQSLTPWAAVMLLSMPPGQQGLFLDMVLYMKALKAGKQISGLESIDEQLDIFSGLTEKEQVLLLEETINHLDEADAMFDEMLAAYLESDIGRLYQISLSMLSDNSQLSEKLKKRLIDDRNRRMLKRIKPILGREKVFITVGALHLPGSQGLLSLMKQAGYSLSALY